MAFGTPNLETKRLALITDGKLSHPMGVKWSRLDVPEFM